MTHNFFKDLKPIQYEGSKSNSSLAFRHYNPDEIVLGKRLEEHLRFAVAYWHSLLGREEIHLVALLLKDHGTHKTIWKTLI